MLKSITTLAVAGLFTIGVFATNAYAETNNNLEEVLETKVEGIGGVSTSNFPVYCDGEYGGDADSISEALAICG